MLVFNFGDDERLVRVVFEKFAELEQVASFADERQGNEIDADFQTHFDVRNVFCSEGGQADFDAGKIDVATAAEFSWGEDFAFDFVGGLGQDLHFDVTVIE